jgi:hypothetical protein
MRIILLAALLTGCSSAWHSNAQDYYNDPNTEIIAETKEVTVTWRKVKDPDAYCRKWHSGSLEDVSKPIKGCSAWSVGMKNNKCTIITGDTKDLELLGHEFRHCFEGQFHKSSPRKPMNSPSMLPMGSTVIPQNNNVKK